jgi:hypothetical protein
MVPPARTALRTDRLRALNVPVPVEVETDGPMPVAVVAVTLGEGGTAAQRHGDTAPQISTQRTAHSAHSFHASRLTSHETSMPERVITEILESWRIDDEWWREPISRRYYDVVLEGGGHVVLFEDLITEKWFVQMP